MSTQGRNCAKEKDKKKIQKVMCSKLSSVVATADFQQKKTKEKDLWIPRRNLKREALAKLSPMKCTLWSWMKSSLTKAKERATSAYSCHVWVWVYKGTVYSTKGTTWSGSPLWKKAQREVRQHWFIYSYISAYTYIGTVHVLSRVAGIHLLVWPPTRDVGRCPLCLKKLRLLKITERWVWSGSGIMSVKSGYPYL